MLEARQRALPLQLVPQENAERDLSLGRFVALACR